MPRIPVIKQSETKRNTMNYKDIPADKTLTSKHYKDAIDSQNAVNLTGITRSVVQIMDDIWKEASAQNKGTDFVNRHPIVRLFAEQILFLSGGGCSSDASQYGEANVFCKTRYEDLRQKEKALVDENAREIYAVKDNGVIRFYDSKDGSRHHIVSTLDIDVFPNTMTEKIAELEAMLKCTVTNFSKEYGSFYF